MKKIAYLLLICMSCFHCLNAQTRYQDSLALVGLYNATDGPNWTITWNLNTPMNGWSGVTLTNGRVTELHLHRRGLEGILSDLNLQNLRFLDLENNQLTGQIPDFTNLPSLKDLLLGYNDLTGQIPDFTNLSNLQKLELFSNQLAGQVPNFTNLQNLEVLILYDNQLTGQIPDFTNLPSLWSLILGWNQLTGQIPDFVNLPSLEGLSLRNNELTGQIPDFTNLPNLEALRLNENQLTGQIPDFTNLPNLEALRLNENQLTGQIPDFTNLPNLVILRLNGNQLTGQIPDFTNLPSLWSLNLGWNQLTGSIPDSINLPNLGFLVSSFNQLTGSIPDFTNYPKLQYLDLSFNQLTGQIPDFTNLTNFWGLHLASNQLTGQMPSFTNLPRLETLNLVSNQLTGPISDFTNFQFMYRLELSNNQFSISDLEQNHIANSQVVNYNFSPQCYPYSQTITIKENTDETIRLSQPLDSESTIQYRWYKDSILIDSNFSNADSIYIIQNASTSDIGDYYVEMIDTTRTPGLTIWTAPIHVRMGNLDEDGGIIRPQDLIINYDELSQDNQNLLEQLVQDSIAFRVDSCTKCSNKLYLYEFNLPEDKSIHDIIPPTGGTESPVRGSRVQNNNYNLEVGGFISGADYQINFSQLQFGNQDLIAAVIDAGFDTGHPRLNGYNYKFSTNPCLYADFTDGDNILDPKIAHGNHILDIILRDIPDASQLNNLTILPVKAFDGQGKGTLFDLICAIYYSINQGAKVINISAAYQGAPSSMLEEALGYAEARNVIIITSAGNGGRNLDQNPKFYPAASSSDALIVVGSIDPFDELSIYSNYSTISVDIATNAEQVKGSGLTYDVSISGTSQASAMVMRYALAFLSQDTSLTASQLLSLLPKTYTPGLSGKVKNGWRLDMQQFSPYIYPKLKVLLEGPYENGAMHSGLNDQDLLPETHPYTSPPWNVPALGRTWLSADYKSIENYFNKEVIDWVLVDFRLEIDSTNQIGDHQTPALLLEDGTVVFPNPPIQLDTSFEGSSLYAVIEHRNHIGVMSDEPIQVTGYQLCHDFTLQDSYTTSIGFGQALQTDFKYAMYAGDVYQEKSGFDINGLDFQGWSNENGSFKVFTPIDLNFDGQVDGSDKVILSRNNGISNGISRR